MNYTLNIPRHSNPESLVRLAERHSCLEFTSIVEVSIILLDRAWKGPGSLQISHSSEVTYLANSISVNLWLEFVVFEEIPER